MSTVLITTPALAQATDGQEGTAVKHGRKEPSNSFEVLPQILQVGEEVKVQDETGRTTPGRVVSISDTQLVIARRRIFRSRAEQAFAKEEVRRIVRVDSTENGTLLGVAAGVGLATASAAGCSRSPSCRNGNFGVMGTFIVSGAMFVPVGGGFGYAIDSAINETIYERPSQAPRVTVAPMLGPSAVGFTAHVQF